MSKDKSLVKFSYKALDETGKKVSGTEMATSTGAATSHCSPGPPAHGGGEQVEPVEVRDHQEEGPRQDVMNFTRQLAVFMKAGVPIMEALEVIVEETQNKMLKLILSEMVDSLRAGIRSPPPPPPTRGLPDLLRRYPRIGRANRKSGRRTQPTR